MAKKAATWLIVRGLGCGLLVLIAAGLLIGGTYWVRGTVSRFDEAVQKRAALEEQFGLAGNLGAFYRDRNDALLDSALGLGEYTYTCVLAYYALLEHSPSDPPKGARSARSDRTPSTT